MIIDNHHIYLLYGMMIYRYELDVTMFEFFFVLDASCKMEAHQQNMNKTSWIKISQGP